MLTICDIEISAPALPTGISENPTTIGEHLKKARKLRKMTREEVADVLDLHESTLRIWEKDRGGVSPSNFKKLVEFLGYSPA